MKLMIPLKDIMITPGQRIDLSETPEESVIEKIRKAYGVIADVMDIHIRDGMVHIEFRDSTPEKFNEAMGKLRKGVSEAEDGKLLKALKLFQEVLSVIPENVDARRNMARVYLDLGNLEKAKKYLFECLQIDSKDAWSSMMLGNIYARNEHNLEVGAFFYDKCLEINPDDPMVACNYAGLMMEKGEFQKAEVLFKKALEIQDIPNAYYGLALLYHMAGHLEPARSVLETFLARSPSLKGIDHSQIYEEARALYKEIGDALKMKERGH
ncbi:MAG: tetratricopeptide repeat protein [Pseudomonadota bacterium]